MNVEVMTNLLIACAILELFSFEKAANLVESNERLVDARTGAYGYRDDGGRGSARSGRGSSEWSGGRGYNRPGQTASNRYPGGSQGGRGRGGYSSSGRGTGNYVREWRDMGIGPRR